MAAASTVLTATRRDHTARLRRVRGAGLGSGAEAEETGFCPGGPSSEPKAARPSMLSRACAGFRVPGGEARRRRASHPRRGEDSLAGIGLDSMKVSSRSSSGRASWHQLPGRAIASRPAKSVPPSGTWCRAELWGSRNWPRNLAADTETKLSFSDDYALHGRGRSRGRMRQRGQLNTTIQAQPFRRRFPHKLWESCG